MAQDLLNVGVASPSGSAAGLRGRQIFRSRGHRYISDLFSAEEPWVSDVTTPFIADNPLRTSKAHDC